MPTAWPIAFPTAITTRPTMTSPKTGAAATMMLPDANRTSPIRWTRFQPMMSASRPIGIISALIVSACAITTQVTARSVIPKSSAIAERATNTMEMLITMVTKEIPMAVKANHLRG